MVKVTPHPERTLAWSITAENEETTLKNILLKFMRCTNPAHGIGKIADSKTNFWKIFWTLVCLGTFGMFIYQVYYLFLLYLSRPISTSVQIIFDKLPSVIKHDPSRCYGCANSTLNLALIIQEKAVVKIYHLIEMMKTTTKMKVKISKKITRRIRAMSILK